jgi:C_GCAxxG_C_C family probable redox protein
MDDLAPWCGEVDALVRVATGFSGGLGDTREELCGALSGGVMLVGALFGRASSEEDDQAAVSLAARYRERFLETFGYTQCSDLREQVVDPPGSLGSCGELVKRAATVLLGLLEETRTEELTTGGEG